MHKGEKKILEEVVKMRKVEKILKKSKKVLDKRGIIVYND